MPLAVYGGNVPLESGNLAHVSEAVLGSDLMSPNMNRGVNAHISQLDFAILQDTGIAMGALIGSNPGPSWHIKGAGDFDGDGKADVLWQNDSGQAAIWLMNGTAVLGTSLAGSNPDPSWQVMGAADLDGDGKSDILWQSNDGQPAAWLMSGTSVLSTASLGTNPGTGWHIIASVR
jgi:hypothetical protein